MKFVEAEVYSAALRFGVIAETGARIARPPEPPDLGGFLTTTCEGGRVLSEWRLGGEVVARRVTTSTGDAHWLRADLVEAAEIALAAEAARTANALADTVKFAVQTRAEAAARPPAPPLSRQLVEAAVRHSKRLGRYFDGTARAARHREQLAHQLRNATDKKEV